MKKINIQLLTLLAIAMMLTFTGCQEEAPCLPAPDPNEEPTPEPEPEPTPTPEPGSEATSLVVTSLTVVPPAEPIPDEGLFMTSFQGVDYLCLPHGINSNENIPAEAAYLEALNTKGFFFPLAEPTQARSVQFHVSPASAAAAFTMENYQNGSIKLLTEMIQYAPTRSGGTSPDFSITAINLLDEETGLIEITFETSYLFGSEFSYQEALGDDGIDGYVTFNYVAYVKSPAVALQITSDGATYTSPFFGVITKTGYAYNGEKELYFVAGADKTANEHLMDYNATTQNIDWAEDLYVSQGRLRSGTNVTTFNTEREVSLFPDGIPYLIVKNHDWSDAHELLELYPENLEVTFTLIPGEDNVALVGSNTPMSESSRYELVGDPADPTSLKVALKEGASAEPWNYIYSPAYQFTITNTQANRTFVSAPIRVELFISND